MMKSSQIRSALVSLIHLGNKNYKLKIINYETPSKLCMYFCFSLASTPSDFDEEIVNSCRLKTEKELLLDIFCFFEEMNMDLVFKSKIKNSIYKL